MKTILLTGGAGFIGSHICVELLEAGYFVVVVDNLSNSSEKAIFRIRYIVKNQQKYTDEEISSRLVFYKSDVCDENILDNIFSKHKIDAVIHLAGFKAVGESVAKPLEYYENNLLSSINLAKVMRKHQCKKIIFSSSATVYGDQGDTVCYTETLTKKSATNPYAWTKWMIEQIFTDIAIADNDWSVVLLRYFNPVGAHPSGLIGEDPQGIPNNLMPFVSQVAAGTRELLNVYGGDYPTPDGTARRDFIHVVDLARGHVVALNWLKNNQGVDAINLGVGNPMSVLEVVHAFEKACGHKINYRITERRAGDLPEFYANPQKAKDVLNWTAQYNLEQMCQDSWRWQSLNPQGYKTNLPEIDNE